MLRRWLQRETINAIDRDDVEEILVDMGIMDKINSGEIHCEICGTVITMENIQCLYTEENVIKICCSNTDCYGVIVRNKI